MGISLLFIDLMFGLPFFSEHNDIIILQLPPMLPYFGASSYANKAF